MLKRFWNWIEPVRKGARILIFSLILWAILFFIIFFITGAMRAHTLKKYHNITVPWYDANQLYIPPPPRQP